MDLINIINSMLVYADGTPTDAPQMQGFNWTRALSAMSVSNPTSNSAVIPPGSSLSIYNGTVASALNGSSVLSIGLLQPATSTYRVTVTAGPSGFRTARTPSSITGCAVTVNNNAVAVFSFTGATLTGVVVGDTMRIAGATLNDPGPTFAFNPINAGLWTVIGISGSAVSCVRMPGTSFAAVAETPSPVTSDVQFYSAAGLQVGAKVAITGTFSPASQKTFMVSAVTPSTFDMVSAVALPAESGLSYVASSITFYTAAKRFLYCEVDQDAVVQLNGDAGLSNQVNPLAPGDPKLVGYFGKIGYSYSFTIVNQSINPMSARWFLAE